MEIVGNVQLVTGTASCIPKLISFLKGEGIETTGNPDLYVREYAHFGVDEARDLSVRAGMRALSGRRVFIIAAALVTTEAQNALLKTLEEPAGDSLFFIIVPAPLMLLPTLRSRAHVLQLEGTAHESAIDPGVFLSASPTERLELLKPLLDKDAEDRRDIGAGAQFLVALEHALAAEPNKRAAALAAVYRARKYWGDKGALSKALLEQVALLV